MIVTKLNWNLEDVYMKKKGINGLLKEEIWFGQIGKRW
jgi:hypothetical protein